MQSLTKTYMIVTEDFDLMTTRWKHELDETNTSIVKVCSKSQATLLYIYLLLQKI